MSTQLSTPDPIHQISVIVQSLPDLRYKDDDWISQSGRQIAIGSIPVSILADIFEVDRLTPDNPEGYQRLATANRVNSLKRELEASRVDLPTAILLNLRYFDESTHLTSLQGCSELRLYQGDRLYGVDGQHRTEALIQLYRDDSEKWGEYSIPFVCLLGADRVGEMSEFYVVNSNAKSIGTGLAYELLKRRADYSAVAREHLTETGRVWVQAASNLTHKLSRVEVWSNRIQFPGDNQRGKLITSNGMATSLRPLVEQPGFFQSIGDADQQVRVLTAYWEGIKLAIPEAMEYPEEYNLQRTLGVTALHAVLVNVLAVMVSKGLSVLDAAKFSEVIDKPLQELNGRNAEGDWVQGADFWRRGAEGASGLFNNRTGHRVLQAQITENLPHVSVQ